MKLCLISDVHNAYQNIKIPECDILISAGDYSFRGTLKEVEEFHSWLDKQPAKHIVSVQGNHELGVEKHFELSKQLAIEQCPRVHFIDEGLLEIEGLKIWCSAITPYFCDWAWNRERGQEIKKHWDMIPSNIDILVTHGPPYGIGDHVLDGRHVGCQDLLNVVRNIKPKLHVFGHIHSAYGIYHCFETRFVNASICDEHYKPVSQPIIMEI